MNTGLHPAFIFSSIVYTIIGLSLMILAVLAVNSVFSLNLKKELMEEHNVASGIVLAGIFIAIAIIVAAAISG